jgi:hypothetical protein
MKPDYEIVLGRGIGAIIFGMTKEELVYILGDPDETYHPEDPDKMTWETLGYDSINCTFSFDPGQEERLVEIRIENSFFHIGHKIKIGTTKEDLLYHGKEFALGDYSIRDDSDEELISHELISFEQAGLNVWIDDGIISGIQILPWITKDGKMIWPIEEHPELGYNEN